MGHGCRVEDETYLCHCPLLSNSPPTATSLPTLASPLPVTIEAVRQAGARIEGVAHRTPVVTSRTANEMVGAEVFFKCENLQRAGAFKFRGAYNALAALPDADRRRGVLTYSSGNHAGALSLAGKLLGVPVTVVMPADAPEIKRAAAEGYGAEIVPYDRHTAAREEIGQKLATSRGLTIIPPYDHPDVIAGAGTAALELFEEVGPLDLLLVCTGGGGFLAGSALAARAAAPRCRVVGVEPEAGNDAQLSLRTGTLHTVKNPDTIADGARTPYLGQLNFAIVKALVDDIVTVDDEALRRAMRFFLERLKLVAEPTGVLGAAALFEGAVEARGLRVGVMVSGGNVDLHAILCS